MTTSAAAPNPGTPRPQPPADELGSFRVQDRDLADLGAVILVGPLGELMVGGA